LLLGNRPLLEAVRLSHQMMATFGLSLVNWQALGAYEQM
jgi:hypothetical protein